MARIAGITFEKDTKGNKRFVRIDLKKYSSEITPFLEKVGAVEPDEFERRWAEGITIEEAKQRSRDFIMNHDYWKQRNKTV